LTDVQVRGEQSRDDRPARLLISDLNSDDKDEIIAWDNDGQLAVLNSDNRLIWQKRYPAGLLAVDTWHLNSDSHRELFLSTNDCRVHVLRADGSVLWEKDFSEMHRKTDELYFRDGCAIFGMAAWPGDSDSNAGVLLTSYFGGMKLDRQGNVQSCFKRTGRFTRIRPVPPGLNVQPRLAVWSDIPWAGPGQLEWWTTERSEPDSTARAPNGPLVFFEIDDYDKNGRPEALIATEQGIGLYDPSTSNARWEHLTEAPVAGVGILLQNSGRQPAAIVYGRWDGFICAVDPRGEILRSTFMDEPVRCLTAIEPADGPPLLLVGTSAHLRCLNANDLAERWREPGSFQHLDVMHVAGQNQLIGMTTSGEIQVFAAKALITH
jgi:outer membrane protein assembly factor BamB